MFISTKPKIKILKLKRIFIFKLAINFLKRPESFILTQKLNTEAKANKFIGYKKNNPVKTLTKKGKSGFEIKFV